jgi:hypothetical protein
MKLTYKKLKGLINETIRENSMLLAEGKEAKYKRIMDILQGQAPDVKTIGLMSGQNPMVQKVSDLANANRKEALEKSVRGKHLEFIRIGAEFGGHPEQSVLILNPTQFQLDKLCREFQQWGFVWGEKFPIRPGESFMAFTMMMIDYDEEVGWQKDPKSKETGFVITDKQMKGSKDFSMDPTSGKKFGLGLYESEE